MTTCTAEQLQGLDKEGPGATKPGKQPVQPPAGNARPGRGAVAKRLAQSIASDGGSAVGPVAEGAPRMQNQKKGQ